MKRKFGPYISYSYEVYKYYIRVPKGSTRLRARAYRKLPSRPGVYPPALQQAMLHFHQFRLVRVTYRQEMLGAIRPQFFHLRRHPRFLRLGSSRLKKEQSQRDQPVSALKYQYHRTTSPTGTRATRYTNSYTAVCDSYHKNLPYFGQGLIKAY